MDKTKRCVTVGTFDGVHLGHKKVIDTLLKVSNDKGLIPTVITFSNHPLSVIAPQRTPGRIITHREEALRLADCNVDVKMIPFDEELKNTSARDWMEKLKHLYRAETIVMGYDNRFGHDGRLMLLTDYEKLGKEIGIEILTVAELPSVSSSAIRKALKKGDVGEASRMLGSRYAVKGTVVEGDAIGRTIGFPTANINTPSELLLPAAGVYSVMAHIENHDKCYKAVANIGVRPTLNSIGEIRFEVHILDFNQDIYGKTVTIEFYSKIRDEKKFESLEELKKQIAADVDSVRNS